MNNKKNELSQKEFKILLQNQKNEIHGYHIYLKLSKYIKDKKNSKVLKTIAECEKTHYEILKKYSGIDVKPNYLTMFFYIISAKILGLTFTLKLMEKGEKNTDKSYNPLRKKINEISKILKDEDKHESDLLNMINESRLNYIGSIVLGLNDALVEFTGALAGYTFAIQKSRTIAMIGLITGIAASLSMASSEFLSKRQESEKENALLSSIYTGVAYIITVVSLIMPFLLNENRFLALGITIAIVIVIIFLFNFYIATAKNLSFKKRFLEMALISLGVASISFLIGILVKKIIPFEI